MRKVSVTTLGATLGAAALIVTLAPPVRRAPSFHVYADRRDWLGLPNAADVLSNLPFLLAGVAGLVLLARRPALPRHLGRVAAEGIDTARVRSLRPLAALAFVGFILIGLGSGGYHLDPGDASLSLDFLPIVLTLSWIAGLVIADRVDRTLGLAVAAGGTLAALASVAIWYFGGGTRGGDMRWYVALQATGVVVIALAALLPPAARDPALDRRWLLAAVAGFLAARALSSSDQHLLDAVGLSGHTLKHLALGAASACVVRATFRP